MASAQPQAIPPSHRVLPGTRLQPAADCRGQAQIRHVTSNNTTCGGTDFEPVLDTHGQPKALGSGQYGTVLLVRNRANGKQYAAKFIKVSQLGKYAEREILVLRSLWHPHVVQFKEAFVKDKYLGIAMEYAPHGSLRDLVRKRKGLSEHEARGFFQQLILGLEYCHLKGVINRDIKLENLLIGELHGHKALKICDFGFAKLDQQSAPKSDVGTVPYMAPEVLLGLQRHACDPPVDGRKLDVWSCGVVLYAMLCCCFPFAHPGDSSLTDDERRQERHHRICTEDSELTFPEAGPGCRISDECQELLKAMLHQNPAARPSATEILRHPWCAKGLGPEVFEFNQSPNLSPPSGAQKVEAIRKVVQTAVARAKGQGAGFVHRPQQPTAVPRSSSPCGFALAAP